MSHRDTSFAPAPVSRQNVVELVIDDSVHRNDLILLERLPMVDSLAILDEYDDTHAQWRVSSVQLQIHGSSRIARLEGFEMFHLSNGLYKLTATTVRQQEQLAGAVVRADAMWWSNDLLTASGNVVLEHGDEEQVAAESAKVRVFESGMWEARLSGAVLVKKRGEPPEREFHVLVRGSKKDQSEISR